MHRDLLPEYQAVYVVSDLHLGGFSAKDEAGRTRNYRTFRETAALRELIGALARTPDAKAPIALVLNGDIVDFLADEEPRHFDPVHALSKLDRAVKDPEQGDVWSALATFVASGRGDLVLVLGNHDLELALPEPQRYLLKFLTGGKPALRGRVIFAMDGAGFACRVGRQRILCLHGNEADPWNAVDYGRLSLIRRALARGSIERNRRVLEGWIPNPGTQMVIEHLNRVKQKYQWIDLLKPEEEATAMIAAAFKKLPALRTFVELVREKGRREEKLAQGFLSGASAIAQDPPEADDPSLPFESPGGAGSRSAQELIVHAIEELKEGRTPEELAEENDFLLSRRELDRLGKLLKLRYVWPESLRDVLRTTLADDQTFETSTVDPIFIELDELCGPDMEFLIAGHTHLHRALERRCYPGKYYFNSGTWMRLLQMPRQALEEAAFREVEQKLENGTLEELEKPLTKLPGVSLLRTTRTVVRIQTDAHGTHGELLTVESHDVPADGEPLSEPGAPPSWKLVRVPNTRLPRGAERP